jgi:hypothetical protein
MDKELVEAMGRIEATVATWRRIGEDQRADDMQMLLTALRLPASNARVGAGDAVKVALQRYGRHNVGCHFDPYGDTEEKVKTCTCGFMKALDTAAIVGDGA